MVDIAQKVCFKCGESKAIECFYKHPRMADGRLNKCKECTKRDTKQNYERTGGNPDYERERSKRPERKAAVAKYQRERAIKQPEKYRASYMLSNAIRDGRLIRKPCEVCGSTVKVQGHHDDYSKPLDVRWLCFKHHREDAHHQKVRL